MNLLKAFLSLSALDVAIRATLAGLVALLLFAVVDRPAFAAVTTAAAAFILSIVIEAVWRAVRRPGRS